MHDSAETKTEAVLAEDVVKVSKASSDKHHEQCLDEDAFPHFAPFLHATQRYANFSGCRFRAASFCGTAAAEACGATEEPKLASGLSGLRCSGPRWESKVRAAPVVAKFAERMREEDPALQEELERASRIAMAETARNAVIAACRRLDMWPASFPPGLADDADCSYEDMSAKFDVIAQRLINDETRRLHCDVNEAVGGLARRAMTASYIVDFAHEIGMQLPPVPETYAAMLTDLDMRIQEWEIQHASGSRSHSSSSERMLTPRSGSTAAFARLRSTFSSRNGDDTAGRNHGELKRTPSSCSRDSPESMPRRELIVEVRSLLDLDVQHEFASLPVFVELQVGNQTFRTVANSPEAGNESTIMYDAQSTSFRYRGAPTEISIRVWRRLGLQGFLKGDHLVGEAVLPLGAELEDAHPRNFQLPLAKCYAHAGAVWIGFCLVEAKRPDDTYTAFSSIASAAVGAVGSMVGAMEGHARDAKLRPRTGFGTCQREDASWMIVTEEGTGLEVAESYFDGRLWRITSRIL
eukprot:CAMPEP_0169074388 /NCGR_PEP_ID=MMETSP1015-20121227/7245_1 /TAXON_ID=342587 /ORGANISM="Karlodinium micrum, Strain CCMP2283" /LENGTH=521 /DNA_ID=CAMNT_0009133695 /DNA_START=20 /DNA_END=1582 /DNA_ORIENTATION=+